MNKWHCFITACMCFLNSGILRSQEPASPKLQLVVAGQEVALPANTATQVISQMEEIVESSSFDSIHDPDIFRAPRVPPEQILKDSFLRVTYPQAHTFKDGQGVLTADRIEAGLTAGGLPGEWLLRDKGHVIELAKYSGEECVHLVRIAGFTERLPKAMQEKLPAYSRIP